MALTKRSVAVPLARVWDDPAKGRIVRTLAWGDVVEFDARVDKNLVIRTVVYHTEPDGGVLPSQATGYIRHGGRATDTILGPAANDVLSVEFVDVQQGDAAVIVTPQGRTVLIDGGANKLFARYLANRFAGTTAAKPRPIEAIVVTHGDADHFAGLPLVLESEKDKRKGKPIFIQPKAVYHNGLVKRPDKVAEKASLGPTTSVGGELYLTGLEEDLRTVDSKEMNGPFKTWQKTLKEYGSRAPLAVRRLQRGTAGAFDGLAQEGIAVEVLGPEVVPVAAAGGPVSGLHFLREPKADLSTTTEASSGSLSASHTINGHSIVLRLTYGKCRLLFTGDLNAESEAVLDGLHRAGTIDLESDVLKVPHHGSADFSEVFMQDVTALVSVVSSGDESVARRVHPPPSDPDGHARPPLPGESAAGLRHRARGVLPGHGLRQRRVPPDDGEGHRRGEAVWIAGRRPDQGPPLLRVQASGVGHRSAPDRRQAAPRLHRQREREAQGGLRVRPPGPDPGPSERESDLRELPGTALVGGRPMRRGPRAGGRSRARSSCRSWRSSCSSGRGSRAPRSRPGGSAGPTRRAHRASTGSGTARPG